MKKALTTALLVFLVPLLHLGYLKGYWRFNYPSKTTYPVRGMDISHHQGAIQWDQIRSQDLHFVYIKASEGGDFADPAFQKNWAGATRAGLVKGAYHFFTFCKPGLEQAQNFIRVVPKENEMLPPAIDFEFYGNCKARPPKKELLHELFQFIQAVETHYGITPILYVTYDSYDHYLKGYVDSYDLWIRDTWVKPQLSDKHAWIFWQYADQGKVLGIEKPVDLNVFYGSEGQFLEAVLKSSR